MNFEKENNLLSSSHAWNLLSRLHKEIPGEKIFSVEISDDRPQSFDMSSTGQVGYDDSHRVLFLYKITCAMKNGGRLVVKQFLPLKISKDSGEKKTFHFVTEKKEYEISFRNSEFYCKTEI